MHEIVFRILILWHAGLVAALFVFALRTKGTPQKIVAVDFACILFVATFALVASDRGDVGYLDIAIALALLGFVQTVAAARLSMRRSDLR